jgi:hypothetical protein
MWSEGAAWRRHGTSLAGPSKRVNKARSDATSPMLAVNFFQMRSPMHTQQHDK